MNEASIISWDAVVGAASYVVRAETGTGGVLATVADIVGTSLPAADILLDVNGDPQPYVGQIAKIRVQSVGLFGTSTGTVISASAGAPSDPANVTIS